MREVIGVSLKNFRCHKEFELNCREKTTLIIGENGSGKTSVLESVYLALRGKSFKGTDKEMIRKESDFYRVEVNLRDARKVIIRYRDGVKEFELDGRKNKRLPRKNRYPVVLFEPDDLHLVSTSPLKRREYFDELFKQVDEKYAIYLRKYQKALKQRNDLLKNDNCAGNDLFAWDILCAQYGAEISQKRFIMLDFINKSLTRVYREIAKNEDECELRYIGRKITENEYLKELSKGLDRDKYLGYTSFGVHRDDYEFVFNKKRADGSASRGEIRSLILALKFIEARILKQELGKKPVVLLDDIFSELDERRQQHLVDNFKDYQMIITSTTVPSAMKVDKRL